MILKLNQYCLAMMLCFLFALLTLCSANPAFAEDDTDPSGLSARERFFNKYKGRVDSSNPDAGQGDRVAPAVDRPSREERRKRIEMKRQERRKARAQSREQRRDKIKAGNDRLEGKAGDVSKKEKERVDARRKQMRESKSARREEHRAKIKKRRQTMQDKASKHQREMKGRADIDRGATGYDDTAIDRAVDQNSDRKVRDKRISSGMDRMDELKKRREAMKKKAHDRRQARKLNRKNRRGNPDVDRRMSPDQSAPAPHVSGSRAPMRDDTIRTPDPHISGGSTSPPIDRPHISGAR